MFLLNHWKETTLLTLQKIVQSIITFWQEVNYFSFLIFLLQILIFGSMHLIYLFCQVDYIHHLWHFPSSKASWIIDPDSNVDALLLSLSLILLCRFIFQFWVLNGFWRFLSEGFVFNFSQAHLHLLKRLRRYYYCFCFYYYYYCCCCCFHYY